MKEREISLFDLVVEILLKWRVIIVWMLVGGILMGCLSYVRSYRTAQTQRAQMDALAQENLEVEPEEIELEELLDSLTDLQINNVNMLIWYEQCQESEREYLQESLRMQLDPMNIPRALLTFQVVAEDVETAQRIVRVYEDMVGGLSQWLVDEAQEDVSAAALSELISLSRSSMATQEGGDSFRIAVCHISKEQCLQLAEKVDAYFQEQQFQLAHKMGEHQIQLVNQEFSFVMDKSLLDSQQGIQDNVLSWRTSIVNLKEALSEEEWQYYNYLTTGEIQGVPERYQDETVITVIEPSVSVKYVFLGLILFAFIYVFYVFIQYILSGKLRTVDDINSLYGVPELGAIPVELSSKKLFAFVDDLIFKVRDWNKRKFSMEEAIGLAAVAVKMAAKKEGLSEICCIGCNLKTNAVSTADAIEKVLKNVDISMKVLNNVLYDQEAMEQMLSAKGAFLLERAGETLYDEIGREIELLQRQEIKVLGIIVVE